MMISYSVIYTIVILLIFISLIEGVESAYFSANRLAIELKRKQGKNSARFWSHYFKHPTQFFSSSIFLYDLLVTILILFIWNAVKELWPTWRIENSYGQMGLTILGSTLLILTFSFFTRSIFHAKATAILNSGFITGIISFLFSIFKRLSMTIVHASEWILKYILNVNFNQNSEAFSKPDIDAFIANFRNMRNYSQIMEDNNIFENILKLSDLKLRSCLVPRQEIIGVKEGVSLEEAIRVMDETKLSRIVVYRETLDSIVGYIHQRDLFSNAKSVKDILLDIPMVPNSMSVWDLIRKFSNEGKSIAWVVDEFGGTAGIITMDNLLQQIFGKMSDEFDVKRNSLSSKISNNEYLLSGRLLLTDISAKYHLKFLNAGDVETLSGFIIKRNGDIPKRHERIIIDDYQFNILGINNTRIDNVKLTVLRQ